MAFWGAFCFGLVIGWVTYRSLRRTDKSGLSDIATVIGAVGGASVSKLFPDTDPFAGYCIGLAIGFFVYFIVSLVVAARTSSLKAVNEWLGEPPAVQQPGGGGGVVLPQDRQHGGGVK